LGRCGPKRIADARADQQVVREIVLHSSEPRAERIYKTYGVDAVQVTTENPYRSLETFTASASRARRYRDEARDRKDGDGPAAGRHLVRP
jgi:hypothetical protein